MKNTANKISNQTPYGDSDTGYFVLENKRGQTVRSFLFEGTKLIVIYRHDNARVEIVGSVKELEQEGIAFDLLGETTQAKLKKSALDIDGAGRLKWVPQIAAFNFEPDLAPEVNLGTKRAIGWSAGIQLGLATLLIVAGWISGPKETKETTVTLLSQEQVEKMLNPEEIKVPEAKKPEPQAQRVAEKAPPAPKQNPKNIVVQASETKLRKNAPVPTRSTGTKKVARNSKGPRGGGYKSDAPRGYGTNEQHMNSIGALGALNSPRVRGGNGGRGGLNLQAVGTEAGSGAGGKGHGGFGSNGSGGKGLGGLGTGRGMGLANSMYGKGLIAAPQGDGGGAPGSGGYGTRGRMGGGAQGAGYGTETIVGSWKGTGPKGNGPAGSGSGNGDPNGSPWGVADGDDGDAIVSGGLDMDAVRDVIMRNIGQVRYCYEQGLQRKPNLSGRVAVKFQISGAGRVTVANVKNSSVRSSQVEGCIVGKLRNWHFPKPQGGVNVAVTYPFTLSRSVGMR